MLIIWDIVCCIKLVYSLLFFQHNLPLFRNSSLRNSSFLWYLSSFEICHRGNGWAGIFLIKNTPLDILKLYKAESKVVKYSSLLRLSSKLYTPCSFNTLPFWSFSSPFASTSFKETLASTSHHHLPRIVWWSSSCCRWRWLSGNSELPISTLALLSTKLAICIFCFESKGTYGCTLFSI